MEASTDSLNVMQLWNNSFQAQGKRIAQQTSEGVSIQGCFSSSICATHLAQT